MLRTVVVAVAVAIALLVPRIADACGAWDMKDVDRKLDVRWVINAGSISSAKGRVAALYLDDENKQTGLRVVKDKKVIFDFAAGKLRKAGKPIATLAGDTLTFGKKVYTFAFSDEKDFHGFPSWKLVVKLGDKTVIESDQATALCAIAAVTSKGGTMPVADQHDEIKRRVAFYLAWREVGA